jgi:hypothetical protein
MSTPTAQDLATRLDRALRGSGHPLERRSDSLSDQIRAAEHFPDRVLNLCHGRDWSTNWAHRGVHLHLECSEFLGALAGDGDVEGEAADVLIALAALTESQGIPWHEVAALQGARHAPHDIHLAASNLVEAVRGKRPSPGAAAASVLDALLALACGRGTKFRGIQFRHILARAEATLARLETAPRYPGESFAEQEATR